MSYYRSEREPMQPEEIHIHVVQADPSSRDVHSNATYVEDVVKSCQADLVVLPELFLSGYQVEDIDVLALQKTDAIVQRFMTVCRATNVGLVVGFIERADGKLFNSLLVIDQDGTQRGPIQKTHLFGKEHAAFDEGDVLKPVKLCGYQWGIMNCFELEFPEIARTLALQGAEGLLVSSANMHPYTEDHVLAVRARSKENRLPVAYANRIGSEAGSDFCGQSLVVDHNGNIVYALDETTEAAFTATLEIGAQTTQAVRMLDQRRPELYLS